MDLDWLATAVRRADAVEFWVALAIGCAVAAAGFWIWVGRLHRARLIEDTPTSRIRSASQGYLELEGTGRLLPGEPVTAPLSGLTCLWWSYRIERRASGVDVRRAGRSRWQTVERAVSDAIFLLEDGSGQCIVDPEGAEVYASARESWYGNAAHPPAEPRRPSWLGLGRRYRYHESRIAPGDPLYALGFFRTHARSVQGKLEEEVRWLLAGWKRDRPALIRRFDTDRDGEVDLEEWERARQAAREQVLRERREQAVLPGLHVLARPDDGRPYLLAALTQGSLIRRHRLWASAGFALFLGGAVAAAALGLARLGLL